MLINSCLLKELVTVIAVEKIFSTHYSYHIPFSCTPDTDSYCSSWEKTRHMTNLITEDVNLRTFRKKAIYVTTIRDIISTIIFLHRNTYIDIVAVRSIIYLQEDVLHNSLDN